ncbi:hypothetical protein HK104_005184, partial [Borealophlyctis nickersoniae]
RLDIADTRLADSPDVNVVLCQDDRQYGIFIKKTNKTHEPEVFLEFKDERLKDAVNTLVDIRKKQRKDRLFLLENGDISKNVNKWFGERFPEVMEQLGIGENLTMAVFRLAFGIKLSWEHVNLYDASLASEKMIEDRMGHSFRMHQMKYNLTALENGEAVGESDLDEEAGDTLVEEAADASVEEAGDTLVEEAGDASLEEALVEEAADASDEEAWDALYEQAVWDEEAGEIGKVAHETAAIIGLNRMTDHSLIEELLYGFDCIIDSRAAACVIPYFTR